MALAKFYSGTSAELETKQKEDGNIYFTTDTKKIVVDIPGGDRTSFGDNSDLQSISDQKVDEIFAKYPFSWVEDENIETLYNVIRDMLLSDPDAVFKGATEDSAGTAGLVPPPITE